MSARRQSMCVWVWDIFSLVLFHGVLLQIIEDIAHLIQFQTLYWVIGSSTKTWHSCPKMVSYTSHIVSEDLSE